MRKQIEHMGKRFLDVIHYMGGTTMLFARTIAWIPVPPIKRRHIAEQMKKIGIDSLPIVTMASLFLGIVLVLQSAYQMQKFQAEIYIASLVALTMTRELGPVLTAFVVAGRVGASITAELGTMRVTEQIDALEALASNPIKYLVVPRFIALAIALPLLTVYADIVGILGGYIVGVGRLGISSSMYLNKTWEPMVYKDIFVGLAKAAVFAVIICIVACYEGMNTEGGAEGVGKSTTLTVVTSFILILAANCVITALFYFAFQVR